MSNVPTWDHAHPMKGKKKYDHVAYTRCSYWDADPDGSLVARHYSLGSALRQFVRHLDIYRPGVVGLWTLTRSCIVLFDSRAWTPGRSPSQLLEMALGQLARAYQLDIPHTVNCLTRLDGLCNCLRAEAQALFEHYHFDYLIGG